MFSVFSSQQKFRSSNRAKNSPEINFIWLFVMIAFVFSWEIFSKLINQKSIRAHKLLSQLRFYICGKLESRNGLVTHRLLSPDMGRDVNELNGQYDYYFSATSRTSGYISCACIVWMVGFLTSCQEAGQHYRHIWHWPNFINLTRLAFDLCFRFLLLPHSCFP